MVLNDDFKFIDLFAGIGGFHCAMDRYSKGKAKCIMASEINPDAKATYEKYFKMNALGDITKISKDEIPGTFDVVCGGFPCQTFSKAGMQQGFGDPRGTLFREIIRLSENEDLSKQPKVMILENVRNLITHDNGVTWNTIKKSLEDINYNVIDTPIVVGPKDFGIPQLRERAIILAVRKDIYNGEIKLDISRKKNNSSSIYDIVDEKLSDEEYEEYKITEKEEEVLDAWNAFIKGINKSVIGFPIWSDEFGDNRDISDLPDWKQDFINKNRKLYNENKVFIDKWLKKYKIRSFIPTYRKFEWQVANKITDVYDGIIQFRPSGIRVKQPTESPTLVAMVHVPIIGKYKRRITINEARKLQSFPKDYDFSKETKFNAYKQLGNAVNVEVIYQVFKRFMSFLEEKVKEI